MMNYLRPGVTNHDAVNVRNSWAPIRKDGTDWRQLRSLKEIKDARKHDTTISLTNHFGGQGISHNEAPVCNLDVPPVKLEKNMMIAMLYV